MLLLCLSFHNSRVLSDQIVWGILVSTSISSLNTIFSLGSDEARVAVLEQHRTCGGSVLCLGQWHVKMNNTAQL